MTRCLPAGNGLFDRRRRNADVPASALLLGKRLADEGAPGGTRECLHRRTMKRISRAAPHSRDEGGHPVSIAPSAAIKVGSRTIILASESPTCSSFVLLWESDLCGGREGGRRKGGRREGLKWLASLAQTLLWPSRARRAHRGRGQPGDACSHCANRDPGTDDAV